MMDTGPDEIALRFGTRLVTLLYGIVYRDTSLTRKRTPLGSYFRPMPKVLRGC